MVPVRMAVVDNLEEFVRRGVLWDPAELAALVEGLEAESRAGGDPLLARLAQPLRSVLARIQTGPVSLRTAGDIESIVYPRLWKIMEAVRDGLPDGEVGTRIEVFGRRLGLGLAHEHPAGVGP